MSYELIVVGTSLGGLNALEILLNEFPASFLLPIVIVQHRGKDTDEGICEYLQRYSAMPIVEVEDKQDIKNGHVYIAPPNYHLLVERGCFALSTEAPVYFARPSIDVLFESAARTYKNRVIALVLTGSSRDGAQGAKMIKEFGGLVIAQDPNSAESNVMPYSAILAAEIEHVLPLAEIGPFLVKIIMAPNSNK